MWTSTEVSSCNTLDSPFIDITHTVKSGKCYKSCRFTTKKSMLYNAFNLNRPEVECHVLFVLPPISIWSKPSVSTNQVVA